MSDFRVVTWFTEQIDLLNTQDVVLGKVVGENSPIVPSGTNFDFLVTVPTINGLCNGAVNWNQEIINTCALLMHMKVRNIGLTEFDVIPFTVQDMDYQAIYDYSLDQVIQASATKLAMIMFFPTDDDGSEGHYAFVEFDYDTKMVIVRDAHGSTKVDKKAKFMQNSLPRIFTSILRQLKWISETENVVKRTRCKNTVKQWIYSMTKQPYKISDRLDSSVAIVEMCQYCHSLFITAAGNNMNQDFLPDSLSQVSVNMRACYLICKIISESWEAIEWNLDRDMNYNETLIAFIKATVNTTANAYFENHILPVLDSPHAGCLCGIVVDLRMHLFCLNCCGMYHFVCWVQNLNRTQTQNKTFGLPYKCDFCFQSPMSLAIVINGVDDENTTIIKWSKLCGIWQFSHDISDDVDERRRICLTYRDGCKEIIQHLYGTKYEESGKSFKDTYSKFQLNFLFQRSEIPPPDPANIINLTC